MLTGEYLVLAGAKALALPTTFGQDMKVSNIDDPFLLWNAKARGNNWLNIRLGLPGFHIQSTNSDQEARTLQNILRSAQQLNPFFLSKGIGFKVDTHLDFNPEWGLGSSSSLVSNISFWANCNPYELNRKIFNGSGYDIACARSNLPLRFHLNEKNEPEVEQIDFSPSYNKHLFFIWLNRKQNTREGINQIKNIDTYKDEIKLINEISTKIMICDNLSDFQQLINKHEELISHLLQTRKVKDRLFPDFNGAIKSLGAWGGDFILATTTSNYNEVKNYFENKGYHTVFRYNEVISCGENVKNQQAIST